MQSSTSPDPDEMYRRKVQTSATVFLYHGNDYLFLKRGAHKRIDPNRLNGVGGRIDPGEDYLTGAIREVKEETGYTLANDAVQLVGVCKLEGGYQEDWVMCFFRAAVSSKVIPLRSATEDGTFVWLDKDRVLDSDFELVDDLNYCWKDIVYGETIFFMTALVSDNHKIYQTSIAKLPR